MAIKHLEIYNFGPIKEVKLDFSRVNVFIGPQSAGKSCILKIACHCAWVEKRLMVSKDITFFQKNNYFFEQLLDFHKLQGYDTNPDLRIVYKTTFLTLEYVHANKQFTCKFTNQGRFYKRAKLSYIPAERNVIATVPNWMELSYEETNTRSFTADWAESRKEFVGKHLSILSLGAEYYYDEKQDKDMVKFDNLENGLPMSNISSGLQSLIPIMLYVHYLTRIVFNEKSESFIKTRDNVNLMYRMYKTALKKSDSEKNIKQSYDLKLNNEFLSFSSEKERNDFLQRYNNYTRYQHSDIFLEEPEENLFPKTQAEVIFHLLQEIFSSERENSLYLATHSPYVLYALNNAILANIIKKDDLQLSMFKYADVKFKASDISVWQIKNGSIERIENNPSNTIQDKSGLIRQNYFDSVMKEVMTDFNNMLSYRKYE